MRNWTSRARGRGELSLKVKGRHRHRWVYYTFSIYCVRPYAYSVPATRAGIKWIDQQHTNSDAHSVEGLVNWISICTYICLTPLKWIDLN